MKAFFVGLFGLAAVVSASGQQALPSPMSKMGEAARPEHVLSTTNVSPRTAMLLLDLVRQEQVSERALSREQLVSEYDLIEKAGVLYANAFILTNEDASATELSDLGVVPGTSHGTISTGLVPVSAIADVSIHPAVAYVQIGERAEPALDNACSQTWVNWVHDGFMLPQSYWGNGVVVGIIDQGFDYTHPNFYDETGNTYRVKRVWEQSTNGTPPAGFSYGRELASQTAILNAQRDNTTGSHGTHVAGIAAGGGGVVNTTYRGVAPQSDLVLVSTPMTHASIVDGIQYIMSYANSVGKPCVINMSIVGHVGPHDGASAFDQYCDGMVGTGKLLVGAAGNQGSDALYLGKTFTLSDTVMYTCVQFPGNNPTSGVTSIDIWGNPNQNYWVSVNVFNSNTGLLEDWTPYIAASSNNTYSYTLYDDDLFIPDACQVTIASSTYPLNNKRNVQILIDHTAQDDSYRWAMIEIIGFNVQTKMWAWGGGAVFTNAGYNAPVLSGSTSSTVGEIGGTGNSIISVGAYTSKNSYTAFQGQAGAMDWPGTLGGIAAFSSKGPTADGRTKPDITAPGNVVVSSVNHFDTDYPASSPYVVSGVTDGTTTWRFAAMQGTSMASPMVTGILALWLEAAPWLTQAQAKALAKNNAWTDSHTGTIGINGSNTWGWGKIDAHEGMLALLATVGIREDAPTGSTMVFPNPSNGQFNLLFGTSTTMTSAEVYDLNGALIHTEQIGATMDGQVAALDLNHLSEGLYILRLSSDRVSSVHRVSIVR